MKQNNMIILAVIVAIILFAIYPGSPIGGFNSNNAELVGGINMLGSPKNSGMSTVGSYSEGVGSNSVRNQGQGMAPNRAVNTGFQSSLPTQVANTQAFKSPTSLNRNAARSTNFPTKSTSNRLATNRTTEDRPAFNTLGDRSNARHARSNSNRSRQDSVNSRKHHPMRENALQIARRGPHWRRFDSTISRHGGWDRFWERRGPGLWGAPGWEWWPFREWYPSWWLNWWPGNFPNSECYNEALRICMSNYPSLSQDCLFNTYNRCCQARGCSPYFVSV